MNFHISIYIKNFFVTLFWFILTFSVGLSVYAFYMKETEIAGFYFKNPVFDFVYSIPLWVYIIICFTFSSILSVFIFVELSIYNSIQRERFNKLNLTYNRFFNYVLTNYFLNDIYKKKEFRRFFFKRIKPFLKNRVQLLSFFESYLKIQETLLIDLSYDFKLLVKYLKLTPKIESFLYNKNFDDKILAMKIISYLRLRTYNKQILKFAQSNNFALRTEAYASLIRLMETDEHLLNLIGTKYNLSLLDVNIIVNAILKNNKMNINYNALIFSENINQTMIGLLLAKYRYKKTTTNLKLIKNYLGNSNLILNRIAWDTALTIVPEDDMIDLIIAHFKNEIDDIKILILQKSKNIASKRYIHFLQEIIQQQPLLIKIEALRIIFENDFDLLATFANSKDKEIEKAYNEVSSIYI